MKLDKQYEELKRIQKVIDSMLGEYDFESIRKLILFLDKNDAFNRLKLKDNQLGALNRFIGIWLEEKTKLSAYGISSDVFNSIYNLEGVEKKYHDIEFGILRIENNLPYETQVDFVKNMIDMKVSGIALAMILKVETKNRSDNMVKLARLLKGEGDYIDAILLLREGQTASFKCDAINLELADTYIEANCLKEAYETLIQIEKPDDNIKDIINELKGILTIEGKQ